MKHIRLRENKNQNQNQKKQDPSRKPVVYFLQNGHEGRKSYFGYTIDLHHRLRQHRKEIQGGAKCTSRWLQVECIGFVTGFPNDHLALSFEWWMKRPLTRIQKQLSTKDLYTVKMQLAHEKSTTTTTTDCIKKNHKRWPHFAYGLKMSKFKDLPLRLIQHPSEEQIKNHA